MQPLSYCPSRQVQQAEHNERMKKCTSSKPQPEPQPLLQLPRCFKAAHTASVILKRYTYSLIHNIHIDIDSQTDMEGVLGRCVKAITGRQQGLTSSPGKNRVRPSKQLMMPSINPTGAEMNLSFLPASLKRYWPCSLADHARPGPACHCPIEIPL